MSQQIKVNVTNIMDLSDKVKEFTLQPSDGGLLPAFSPGSHIMLEMADGKFCNAYSLVSSPFKREFYLVAVRLQNNSRGGSRYMHESVRHGDELKILPPANYFAFESHVKKRLLIAGGIGITPFMSLLVGMDDWDPVTEMHYAFRSRTQACYLDVLSQQLGNDLHTYCDEDNRFIDVSALLTSQPLGTHIYVCGPEGLIEVVSETARSLGWPASQVHYEKFSAGSNGDPFHVFLKHSGIRLKVNKDESLLDAIEKQGISIKKMCRAGVCGECKTKLLSGTARHCDNFLSEDEKSAGDCIMPCVSRAEKNSELVLEL